MLEGAKWISILKDINLLYIALVLSPLYIYLFLLFRTYKRTLEEVIAWNKQLGHPMEFSYSWMRGVRVSPIIPIQEKRGSPD